MNFSKILLLGYLFSAVTRSEADHQFQLRQLKGTKETRRIDNEEMMPDRQLNRGATTQGAQSKENGDKKPSKDPLQEGGRTSEPVTIPVAPGDLGIRFSKVEWEDPSAVPMEMQRALTMNDFPLSGDLAYWVRQSKCPSVILEEDCRECEVPFDTLVQAVGGYPSHASSDPNAPYWVELREVANVQKLREDGADPHTIMPLADIWQHMNIAEVAEAVHDEIPGIHHITLIQSLLAEGAPVDRSIIPFKGETEFLRGPVMLADLNTWAIGTVGPHNFGVKYHVGRARPEEVAWLISRGEITSEVVPVDIVDCIDGMNLGKAVDFTAYPEGSPMHPSWPAMHSAASVGSLWLAVVMDLTEEQWCQAKLLDYDIAYARTVAGVHYPTDNTAGLALGQEILARYLPGHLAVRYGSDKDVVRQKIEEYRFDWNTFLATDCAKNA